jgi:hypothetical protein
MLLTLLSELLLPYPPLLLLRLDLTEVLGLWPQIMHLALHLLHLLLLHLNRQ